MSKKKKTKISPVKVLSQYMLVTGFNTYKLLTIYEDGKTALGCEQQLSKHSLIEVKT